MRFFRHYKKSKNTCEKYASKKARNCKKKDEFGVKGKHACPATCGECAVCEDSASWFFKKSKNTCEAYVSKKSKNCKKRDASGAKAKNACPMTCGAC